MASREEVPVERKCSHNSSNSEVAPASAASTSVAPHVVHLIAAMRILNPEVLRVTYVYQAFRNCAESFRPRARKLYHYSRKSATLEEGAFILSQWGSPNADVSSMRTTLERLARRATMLGARRQGPVSTVPTQAEVRTMVSAVNQSLYEEFGLKGNQADYYNPENSMMHSVLSKKMGIPISLSVVWAAVARRCGLVCHPLANVPRHVLIRIPATRESGPAETQDFYLDAFDGGKLMSWQEFCAFLTDMLAMMGARMRDIEPHLSEFVAITPPVLLYLRMMRNLENVYGQTGDKLRLQGIQLQMRTLIRLVEEEATRDGNAGYRR